MGIIKKFKAQSSNFKVIKGFTFIEMVVSISVIGLALPALFAIIFVILQQQIKIYRLSEVKRQGDYALNIMENIIRNYAKEIYSDQSFNNIRCNTQNSSYSSDNGQSFYFKDKDNNWLRFYTYSTGGTNYLASESAKVNSINLTSNKLLIDNFVISCFRTSVYSLPMVSVRFTLRYNTTSTRLEETATLNYQTNIKLRSY